MRWSISLLSACLMHSGIRGLDVSWQMKLWLWQSICRSLRKEFQWEETWHIVCMESFLSGFFTWNEFFRQWHLLWVHWFTVLRVPIVTVLKLWWPTDDPTPALAALGCFWLLFYSEKSRNFHGEILPSLVHQNLRVTPPEPPYTTCGAHFPYVGAFCGNQ